MTQFSPFPRLDTAPRLCGVEIEFSGLTETQTAEIAQQALGGQIARSGPHDLRLTDSALGTLGIELDTALRKADGLPGLDKGLDLARGLVPVEIVTEPLPPGRMPQLSALCDALREAGAEGSRAGLLLGFGVHLNPARIEGDATHPGRIALAYGLSEDWLRRDGRIDPTRRLLPFVDPWPRGLTDALERERPADTDALAQVYAEHTQSRNHGLDLLPLLKDADPESFARLFPDGGAIKPRPAYHFRLPDCRIDEPDWSLAQPWRDWMAVERLAEDTDRLEALCAEWAAHRDRLLGGSRDGWTGIVAGHMEAGAEVTA
ncbi:amidoligase family protein [Thetidibacter halocola]|uniref:Amidoligase family protein n=1 Tax=Thetidibacter halocola TaxID=2827239 RepID=A0A8J7WEF0_9RHOB|nr:amidoligase family protein [Thetidibacter halocola]MBS0123583.1 amidoligase family protein [Thetidibacter halocola]